MSLWRLGTFRRLKAAVTRTAEPVTSRCQRQEVRTVKYNAASPVTDLISSFFIFIYAVYNHQHRDAVGVISLR